MLQGRLIIFAILFFTVSSYCQNISFISEKIVITINDSNFTISGKYYFLNNNDKEISTSIYYPFKVDEDFLYPDSILILNKKDKFLNFSKGKKGIYFSLKFSPKDTTMFTAFYRQKNLIQKAEYILTTTQNWNAPLQKAEYIVNIPLKFKLKSLSLKPDSANNNSIFKTFYITKKNYMPKTNLIVEWERSKK